MASTSSDNKRIAKNTIMLYIRMFFSLIVSLYTSRVILNVLGVTDYGINNVVGGVVTMFTFMNGAMASATQRYLNIDLGRNDIKHLRLVFRTGLQVHFIIAFLILLLAETVGLWFVCNKLVIPPERFYAAQWVYQFSVISCLLSIISSPFNAEIIAHERMSAFAYMQIFDVTAKLLIVYLLVIVPFDKLITYAFLFLCVQIIDQIVYQIYTKKNFPNEVNFSFKVDKSLIKEMSGFVGWSLFGHLSGMLYNQGINMLLNMFFGPAVNAARGIAVQVQNVVRGFISNIQMAVNPQITKSYAVNDMHRMHTLMFASTKFCYYLLFMIVLPLSLEAYPVLVTWLKIVPDHTVNFLRLILAIMLLDCLINPFVVANQATGKVKVYQLVCGGIQLLIVPIAYIALKLGCPPESVFVVHFLIMVVTMYCRVFLMKDLISLPPKKYFNSVVLPILKVTLVSTIVPLSIYKLIDTGLTSFLMVCITSVLCVPVCSFLLGMNAHERNIATEKAISIAHKIRGKF